MKRLRILALAWIVLVAPVTVFAQTNESERFHQILRDRFAWELREFPDMAVSRGDYSNAGRISDNSLSAINRRHEETVACYESLRSIDPAKLAAADLINLELFELTLREQIDDHRFRMFLAPIGQRFGPHLIIARLAEHARFQSAMDYDNYLSRLLQVPRYVENSIARMRIGLKEGIVPPQVAVLGVVDQLDGLLNGGLDELAGPFDSMPERIPINRRRALRDRFETEAAPAVEQAVLRLAEFFNTEYLPRCRQEIAATSLPDGKAYYAHQLWKMTTTEMTAQEIHELGLREVARIRAEMMQVIRRSDFLEMHPWMPKLDDEALFEAFLGYLRTDPRFYYEREEDLLDGYKAICKTVDGWLPKFFRTLPRLPYGVRKIPDFMAPQQTTAYYSHGSIENGEAGNFFANTYALDQRPKYEMIALAMHEAVPGHHLQSALAKELGDVPEFRQELWFNVFGEGWALYAERLGLEMGLYEDPYDDFGRLLYEMWRASRLVVDPGMHALGWTRDEAIEFMRSNTALSEINIETEIDRYIAWPGQACAYKIGELRIRGLRSEAEERLGAAFDIRAFHDVVLGAGSVPLTVLERRVHAWIDAAASADRGG